MRARDLRRLFEILVAGCATDVPNVPPDAVATDATMLDASADAGDATIADAAPDVVVVDAGVDAPDPCAKTDWTPPVTDLCADFFRLPCGIPSGIVAPPDASCFFLLKDCAKLCKNPFVLDCRSYDQSCDDAGQVVVDSDGGLIIECTVCSIGPGRSPEGFAAPAFSKRSALAAYFERAAMLEAASVFAFERLARELEAHGAPAHLARDARRAARDERRHARIIGALARRFGGVVRRTLPRRLPVRSLEAVLVENAREGCVMETYAALVAHVQAACAADASIKKTMQAIARDETRHASLAFRIAAWAPPSFRPRMRQEMRAAVETLASRHETPPALSKRAGLPTLRVHVALVRGLEEALWT